MLDRRSRARAAATISLIALATAGAVGPHSAAHAEPTPPPAPTQGQVDAAKAAAARAAARAVALQRELDAAETRLDAVSDRAAAAAEAYNGARVLLATRTAEADAAVRAASATARSALAAKDDVDDLAAHTYMAGGSLGAFGTILGLVEGTGDVARNAADLDAVTGFRDATLVSAQTSAARAAAAQRAAAAAHLRQKAAATAAQDAFAAAQTEQEAAAAEQTALETRRTALVAELARLNRTSAALEQQRQDALAAARAKAEARARARAAAAAAAARATAASAAPGARSASVSAPQDLPEPDSDSARTAIEFAKAQLGEMYLWAAAGPDRWDCSGLTQGAWKAAGHGLTHWSVAQYRETARVPVSDLAPGDLVFFGGSPSTIHHVGLYVGDGMMIEAPRSGKPVRYSSIYRSSLLPHGGRVG
ncbi:C40 family peptidase [Agilicoccus flavus]|uniref:C40 family peptidase n=1 Tax=Agilicoccus flavus TaxID=2775968 RepID=UPI001CF70025|nr:C40 family peptidase [Agilicoccus flavus]